MKSIKSSLLLVFALTLTIPSCKKDKAPKSNQEILTSQTWKWSSVTYNGGAVAIPDCIKDNTITFASNGTYIEDTGTVLCEPDETAGSGTWAISADGKNFIYDGDAFTFKITESQLVLTLTQGVYITVLTFISL